MSDTPKEAPQKATTLAAWKKAATHYPLLPSGVRVGIKIPDLAALIETGEIPQHLLDVAFGIAMGENVSPSIELVKQQREFTDTLVQKTVVDPPVSPDDVADVPFEDKDFIVAVATRQRDLDAEGEHLAGLTKSEKFRKFRRLGEFDEALANV